MTVEIQRENRTTADAVGPRDARNEAGAATLPLGAVVQRIAFLRDGPSAEPPLLTLAPPLRGQAILVQGSVAAGTSATVELKILSVPQVAAPDASGLRDDAYASSDGRLGEAGSTDSDALVAMREWVQAPAQPGDPPALMLTLQGAQVCWGRGRCAVRAPAERLDALRRVLVEVAFFERELSEIEAIVGEAWPRLESDTPLAFEFDERSLARRAELRIRLQQVLLVRARLARLGPWIDAPHIHPPTLASQVAERLRERLRMGHRREYLGDQLDIYQDVYEACGQRASDYLLARRGHTLEWIIIVLLAAQLLMQGLDLLSRSGQ